MAKKEIRFGVRDLNGLVSSTWKCWITKNNNKNDIYIANRVLGDKIKISLHESGNYRLAFLKNFLEKEAPPESELHQDRVVESCSVSNNIAPGVTLAVRVYITNTSVNHEIGPKIKRKKIIWAEKPEDKMSTLFLFFITEKDLKISNWPAKRSKGTKLIGSLELDDGRIIWIVYNGENIDRPAFNFAKSTKFNSANYSDLMSENLKMVYTGIGEDGSLYLVEVPIKLEKKGKDSEGPFLGFSVNI